MTILPIDPLANASPEALAAFLGECRKAADKAGKSVLVSISVEVDALDPLAVLESIFEAREAHFYVEKASDQVAVAGAEAVLMHEASGEGRFASCRAFVDDTLSRAIAVGAAVQPFGGPLFFSAFSFLDQVESGEPFPSARVFVPRWQVGCQAGRTIATANLLVEPGASVLELGARIWRAHSKFRSFRYEEARFAGRAAEPQISTEDVGGAGHYQSAVTMGLELIRSGCVEKIVLARAQDLNSSEAFHPLQALNGLRERYPECYAFSVANGRGQSFIGASPERLLRVAEGQFFTEALAGSARRGLSASEDAALGGALLRDEKELREHSFVIASIERRLSPLGLRLHRPERPQLRRLANVQHLHSPLHAEIPEGLKLLDILACLHPTPAVGGSPRGEAVPRIRGLEAFSRGLYAGALGWMDARGDGEFFVGLRSALIDGHRARLYAGAGIVAGSNPDREYAETELKIRAMREAMLRG